MTKVLAVISFIDQHGRPVDPGFGGGIAGGHPDQGLPGYGHPDHDLPSYGHPDHDLPGRPARPSQGLPGRPNRPDNSLPWHPVSKWPPDETDPDWGVGAPRPPHPGYLPIDPAHPGNALPPVHGHPAPPIAGAPPGTIWPPLPGDPPKGKAALIVWLTGIGWRYVIVDLGASAGTPLPGTPPHVPGQALPPTAQPK